MMHDPISTRGHSVLPNPINPTFPVIEYLLEGQPLGVAIPQPGIGKPQNDLWDGDCLPTLEKRWCIPSEMWLQ